MENLGFRSNKEFTAGIVLALVAVVLWSGNFIVARVLKDSVSPVTISFFRWLLATLILFPFAFNAFRNEFTAVKKAWLLLTLAAITGVSIFNTFLYIAGKYTTATNLALIGTTAAPVFVLIMSALFLKIKVGMKQWLGAFVCIIGLTILITDGSMEKLQQFSFTKGDVWILAAAFSFAIYTILVRRKPPTMAATTFLFAIFFIGTLFLLPFYLLQNGEEKVVGWSTKNILIFIYISTGASVISFLSWNIAIRKIGAARTALFGNLIPVFSTVEAAIILDERFTIVTFISFVIIMLGIVIANYNMFGKKTSEQH